MKFKSQLLVILAVALYTLVNGSAPASAQPSADGKTYLVSTITDSGDGSFRAAIEYANAHPGTSVLFASSVGNIGITSELPAIIANGTVIDASPNKVGLVTAVTDLAERFDGLTIQASNCLVRGLYFNNFAIATHITGVSAQRNRIEGCNYGFQRFGVIDNGNNYHVRIDDGAKSNVVGGTLPAEKNSMGEPPNQWSNGAFTSRSGLVISGTDTSSNRIVGNYITGAFENGILIEAGASKNSIGGAEAGAGNEIISNRLFGVLITSSSSGTNTDGTVIQGNRIYFNGASGAPDPYGGIALIGVRDSLIGGTTPAARNIISGNARIGIQIQNGGKHRILGNYIGTTADGTASLNNSNKSQVVGILAFTGESVMIGGAQPGAGNLISGNSGSGIEVGRLSSGSEVSGPNYIQGNRIGTSADGMRFVSNQDGIRLNSRNQIEQGLAVANYIGGATAATGNLISGNTGAGILVESGSKNQISNNIIGPDIQGVGPIGNSIGIHIKYSSFGNHVGQSQHLPSGAGNLIAFNLGQGICIESSSQQNELRGNSVWRNGRLGIDLFGNTLGSVTPNDPLDADGGANGLQNFPAITSVSTVNGRALVTGTFNSKPSQAYTLDFYGVEQVDPSGHGEGQVHLGTTNINTDANGDATFSFPVTPGALSRFVTATATSTDGTSEFSNALALPPSVQFSSDNFAVDESAGTATISVTRSGSLSGAVSVGYSVANGSAVYSSDYALTSGTLYFADGESSKTFTVSILNDTLDEANETVRLLLRTPSGAVVGGAPSQATLTIIDDDASSTLSIGDASMVEGAEGTTNTANFTVTLSAAAGQQVIVRYSTSNGTAQQPTDYTYATGTLTFSPGQTVKTIAVPVKGDAIIEADETIRLNLIGPINATLARGVAIGSIINDDFPSVSVNDTSTTESAGGSAATFTVSLSAPSLQTVRINYTTSNNSAVAPDDFAATSGTLEFAPGVTSRTVNVTINDDTLDENNESFRLHLLVPTHVTIARSSGVGTILDNDDAPTLSVNDAMLIEGDSGQTSNATFTVSLSTPSSKQVLVRYYTSDGTARQPGDYGYTTGTLVFAPGQTSKSIVVEVYNDSEVESQEKFTVNLIGPNNATIARGQGTGTISDDDGNSLISFGGRIVPIVITSETYNAGKQSRQPMTLTYASPSSQPFGYGTFVLTDLRESNAKSVTAMADQIVNGAQPGTVAIGYTYPPLYGSGTEKQYCANALETVFQNAAAAPWYDSGNRYTEIITGLSPSDNPRIMRLVVAPEGALSSGAGAFQIADFAPVYVENVHQTQTTLTLTVRFSPPAN